MKITNKYNLPQALVDLVLNSQHSIKPMRYSVTTILNPARNVLLSRRHNEELESDVTDNINTIFGTAVHGLIEKFDKTGFSELHMEQEICDGYYLTGQCDLYDEPNHTLVDYKTASVWKILKKDFEDWKKQGLMYAWLLIKQGHIVDKLKFHAILKDWTARELRAAKFKGDFYPESQVYTWEYTVNTQDLIDIELFINNKFSELIRCEALSDDDIPDCDDTWYTGDKYAVYKKKDDSRAYRVFDTEEEAKNCANFIKGIVVYRKGERRRCQDYCECKEFCKYGKESI